MPFPLFGGGFAYYNRLQKKVGTLILTSLLEDLVVISSSVLWEKRNMPSGGPRAIRLNALGSLPCELGFSKKPRVG